MEKNMERSIITMAFCAILLGDAMAKEVAPQSETAVSTSIKTAHLAGLCVYASRFDEGATDGWARMSSQGAPKALAVQYAVEPVAGKSKFDFLGEYFRDTVRLNIDKLPEHQLLVVEYDLLILKTWGGDGLFAQQGKNLDNAPDRLTVSLGDGRVLTDATFSNEIRADGKGFRQSFPDNIGDQSHSACTGAWLQAKPGPGVSYMASVYRLRLVVPHSADSVVIEFKGQPFESSMPRPETSNESWGLANVRVFTVAQPVKLTQDKFDQHWASLAAKDPMKAWKARWSLTSAGPAVMKMIREEIYGPEVPGMADKVKHLIKQLDQDPFQQREAASQALRDLGSAVRPVLRTASINHKSPEMRARAVDLLQQLKSKDVGPRPNRLRYLLEIIGSDEAKSMLKSVGAVSP
ncbi:MAG TPA: hypothetical protein DEP88_05800 [Verrucomicrobiales bacterium]|nr:hypothetical protein [Verrucomicrobiales bacterium]